MSLSLKAPGILLLKDENILGAADDCCCGATDCSSCCTDKIHRAQITGVGFSAAALGCDNCTDLNQTWDISTQEWASGCETVSDGTEIFDIDWCHDPEEPGCEVKVSMQMTCRAAEREITATIVVSCPEIGNTNKLSVSYSEDFPHASPPGLPVECAGTFSLPWASSYNEDGCDINTGETIQVVIN